MMNPRTDDPKKGDSADCTKENTSQAKLIRMGMPVAGAKDGHRPVK